MNMFENSGSGDQGRPVHIAGEALDGILTLQLTVAWAGDGIDERRLGWWQSDMTSEFGGHTLFQHLLPRTWEWAVLQAARESARRKDAELRSKHHDADLVISLFNFGFETDERLDGRLQDLKRSGQSPFEALPSLSDGILPVWNRERFGAWVGAQGRVEVSTAPLGRRISGDIKDGALELARTLVAALNPLAEAYPLPHFRRPK